jgi:hypothetical protein
MTYISMPVTRVHDDANAEEYLITTSSADVTKNQKVIVNLYWDLPDGNGYNPDDPAIYIFQDIQASGVEAAVKIAPFQSSYTYQDLLQQKTDGVTSHILATHSGPVPLFAISGPASTFLNESKSTLLVVAAKLVAKITGVGSHFT